MKKPTTKLLLLLPLMLLCGQAKAAVYTFSGTGLPILDASGSGPAAIVVSGIPLGETVVDVDVTILNFSHAVPDDTAGVITGPGGQFVMLFDGPGGEVDVINQTWIFDDSAALALPFDDALSSGTWRPSNEYDDELPNPAPAGPYPTTLATFNGSNPNGTWELYVADYVAGDAGTIGGWTIRIVTVPEPGTALLAGAVAAVAGLRRRR